MVSCHDTIHVEGLGGTRLLRDVSVSYGNERPAGRALTPVRRTRAHSCDFTDRVVILVRAGSAEGGGCSLECERARARCTCRRGLARLRADLLFLQHICSKCGICSNSRTCPAWLCRICQEQQEVRERSQQGQRIELWLPFLKICPPPPAPL